MPSLDGRSRHTVLTLCVVVLLGLAGCGGLSGSDATPSPSAPLTDTPTASPTASPTTPTPASTSTPSRSTASTSTLPSEIAAERLPAGIATAGVRNVSAVMDAHRARVVATPGVAAHTTNATAGGRHVLATARVVATANLTRVRYVSRSRTTTENGTRATVTVIAANETTVGQYTAVNGNVTLDNRRNRTEVFDRSLRGLSTAANPLRGTLRRGNFTVVDVETVDGTELLTLRADRYAGGQLYETSDVANYTATVRITGDGLIRSASERIVGTAAVDGRRYEFAYRFEPTMVDLPPTPRVPEGIRAAADTANDTERTPTPAGISSATPAST